MQNNISKRIKQLSEITYFIMFTRIMPVQIICKFSKYQTRYCYQQSNFCTNSEPDRKKIQNEKYRCTHRVAHFIIDAFLAVGIILADVAWCKEVCPHAVYMGPNLCLVLAEQRREEVIRCCRLGLLLISTGSKQCTCQHRAKIFIYFFITVLFCKSAAKIRNKSQSMMIMP